MAGESREAIAATITQFIKEDVLQDEDASLNLGDNLFTNGIMDSISIMRLIARLQSTYEYKIPPTDLVPENFQSINAMAAYLSGQLEDR